MTENGLILPSDMQKVLDGMARTFATLYNQFGIGAPEETTTLSAYLYQMQKEIMGDGGAVAGIGNIDVQQQLSTLFGIARQQGRYDIMYGSIFRPFLDVLDNHIISRIPPGWAWGAGTAVRAIDAYLLRANAMHAGIPSKPNYTLTTTATTGGSIPSCGTSPTPPRITITFVGSYDYQESQPCTPVQAASLSGKNNAWSVGGLTGNVPAGVTKCRMYRQILNAGVNDPYFYDGEFSVKEGVAWTVYNTSLVFTKPDSELIFSIRPPVFKQLLIHPETAAIIAMTRLTSPFGNSILNPAISANSLLSSTNVALNPVNLFLGKNNPESSGLLGTRVLGSAYVQGEPRFTNDGPRGIQGFAGAAAVRVRVTTALSGGSAATVTALNYTYLDENNPSSPQTGSWTGSVALADAIGSIANIPLPTNRVIREVTSVTVSGRTSGAVLVEAQRVRSL